MNANTTDVIRTAPATRKDIYQTLVLRSLRRMSKGHLTLTLPDGAKLSIGDESSEVRAAISVRDAAFFRKCVLFGDVGFGEAYVDGDWDTDSIERVVSWAILNIQQAPGCSGSRVRGVLVNLLGALNRTVHRLRANTIRMSRRNITEHYDLGNAFYGSWLDATMTYSSARFTSASQTLEEAQFAKYESLCSKLAIGRGHHVLEIGCGWGGFAVHAARQHGCRVTGITISPEQLKFARERVAREGLAHLIDLRLEDYRRLSGRFDRIVSIEMMEALGDRYLGTYCARLDQLLAPDGLVGLQYITVPDSRHADLRAGVDFIQKHIFPGSLLLSVGRVSQKMAAAGDLFLHDLSDLGASYAHTLRLWHQRFNARFGQIQGLGFDERFRRKWNYYLQYCEAAFASRNITVVQAIYTRPNNPTLHVAYT